MGKYNTYQETSYRWLPQVPTHWSKKSIRQITSVLSERCGNRNLRLLSVYREYGVIPKDSRDDNHNKESLDLSNYKVVHVGNLVLNKMKMWQGSLGVSRYEGIVSPAYIICKVLDDDINLDYLHLLLRSARFKSYYNQYSYGIRVGQWDMHYGDFKNLKIFIPPRAEQDQIVRFLDWKVSEINKLIGIRRKEIQGLNRAKESIITMAVTQGIKKEKQYKTNNKYYEKLPFGWHITKTRRVLLQPLTDGPHTTPQFFENGIPFVSAEAVSCGNGHIDFEHIRGFISYDFYKECCKKYIPQINDIYMIKSGATTGRVAIVDTDKIFTIWSPLAVFRCNPSVIIPQFLFYALQAKPYQQQVQDGWSYGTQQNIGMRVLEKLKIAYPDIAEQNEITSYLGDKCSSFERLIQLTKNKIKKLMELKNTIISDVVTGKIDVRNIPIPEYEHVDDLAADDGEDNDEETGVQGEED